MQNFDCISDDSIHVIMQYSNADVLLNLRQLNYRLNRLINDRILITKIFNFSRLPNSKRTKYINKYAALKIVKNIDELLFFGSFCDINIFDIAASCGRNDLLLILKKEFPNIKGTSDAFNMAAGYGISLKSRLQTSIEFLVNSCLAWIN